MALTKQKKEEIVGKFKTRQNDDGNSSVQIALLTERIKHISKHFTSHSKDHSSQLGLTKLVEKRKKLLTYLNRRNPAEYKQILKQLDLRK